MLHPDRPSPEVRSEHHEYKPGTYFTIDPFATSPMGTLPRAVEPAAVTPADTVEPTAVDVAGTRPAAVLAALTPAATFEALTFPVVLLREAIKAFLVAARLLIRDFFCIFDLFLRQILVRACYE